MRLSAGWPGKALEPTGAALDTTIDQYLPGFAVIRHVDAPDAEANRVIGRAAADENG
jgi:hypothetical protein